MFFRIFERKNAKEDLYGYNMGWEDVPDKMQYLHDVTDDANANNTVSPITANTGAKKRNDSIVNVDAMYCIEKMLMPFFSSGDQYIPTNNTLRVKFTRESQWKFLTMSEHKYAVAESDFHHAANLAKLEGVKVNLNEFYMHFKHVTPNDLIQSQINAMIEKQGKTVNVFTQEVHVKTSFHNCENSKFSVNDIFGRNIPYQMILGVTRNDYYNGDAFVPPFYFGWEKTTSVVKVNNIPICYTIKNSKDAYFHTRWAVHLEDFENMHFSYDYEKGHALMVFELSLTEDSNI